jgi:cell division protein FtsA
MARKRYFCGLDVGTTKICCLIGLEDPNGRLTVVGVSVVPTRVEDYPGEIIANSKTKDLDLVADRIRDAVTNAERMAGAQGQVKDVAVGIAGHDLIGQTVFASVAIGSPDTGVTERDLARVYEGVKRVVDTDENRSILQLIPHSYTIDKTPNIHKPMGLCGSELKLFAHVVTAQKHSTANVYKCVVQAGYRPIIMAAQGIASAECILTEAEKQIGTILVDMGGGTTDFAAYLGGSVVASGSLNHGGEEITLALAKNLHIHPDSANDLKVRYGRAMMDPGSASESFTVDLLTTGESCTYRREDISATAYDKLSMAFARVVEQFEASGYLCQDIGAGVKLTGGGSLMLGIEELAAGIFNRPTALARPLPIPGFDSATASPIYSTACGLLLMAQKHDRPSSTDVVTDHTLSQKLKFVFRKILSLYTGG